MIPALVGLATLAGILTARSNHEANPTVQAVVLTVIGVIFGVSGVIARMVRPDNGTGLLLLLVSFLSISMFPQIAMLSGLFELIRALGLYNSRTGLTLSYLVLTCPFTVWLLTTYMREIPREIEEAAIIDGASPWTIAWRVFAPVMAPALVSTGLLAFVAAWNEFLFALTFTLTPDQRTVPVAIALMSGASAYELPWGQIMAASVIVSVPIVALALVFQRRIVAGLTAGAVR